MESILRSLVASSQHNDTFKDQLLKKMFSSFERTEMSSADCTGLFRLFFEWILFSDRPNLIGHGHRQLVDLANRHLDVFKDSFVTPNLVIDIFSNPINVNKVQVAPLIKDILDLIHEADFVSRSIINVAKAHLVHFLRDHGIKIDVAASVAKLYAAHPALLPNANDWTRTTALVINLLAGYRDDSETTTVSQAFVEKADSVSQIFSLIWGQSSQMDCIKECLRLYYVIISSSDSYSRPSCALMSFVDKVPNFMMEQAMANIIEETGSMSHEEGRTVVGLQTMVEWLTQRPSTLMSGWIMHMLQGLHKSNRVSVLIEITHGTLEKLLVSLSVVELQESTEPIFFYLLLGFQHSETAFHRIIAADLPDTFLRLSKSCSTKRSQKILDRLVESVNFMLALFPGFPELYDPVSRWLDKLAYPQPDKQRIDDLKTLAWLATFESLGQQQQKSCVDGNAALGRATTSSSSSSIGRRSETGLVGLVNLGNTCYMNSVLQALYITRIFCDLVLVAPPSPAQSVLLKLQQTFTYLRQTMRAIYSPSEFLRAARPPWFEAGRQQDCSEFLRYLLDTLHEQERSCSKGATTYREHKVIEPNNNAAKTPPQLLLQVNESETEVKSSVALDAISEAPEIGDIDVDMMSQGSGIRMDEDFMFGSRGSLSNANRMDSEDEEEYDEDVAGSQSSLAGMKRWTTEENLSFGGSREGRIDLLDGPLNDSHSNSTDSGIQSVGDSIRGSSDSMSNTQSVVSEATTTTTTSNESKVETKLPPVSSSLNSSSSSVPFESLVQKVFGGKMQTTYECCNCKAISLHKECFTDLHLAFPETNSTKETSSLTVQQMLGSYLKPEMLAGENQYHCDRCGSLQDAIKTVKIIQGPDYLMCTLMRFHYDRSQNRKSKIFTDIKYELDLELNSGDQIYSLYAVVVHSGYSSDGGHYYTYAREPLDLSNQDQDQDLQELLKSQQQQQWYIFNDSKVSFTTFESFVSVSKRFPRDTAYVLFYQKLKKQSVETKLKIRSDLKMPVEKDNIKFMREKERYNFKKDGDEDKKGGGSNPPPTGCGGGGFNTPGRFVC